MTNRIITERIFEIIKLQRWIDDVQECAVSGYLDADTKKYIKENGEHLFENIGIGNRFKDYIYNGDVAQFVEEVSSEEGLLCQEDIDKASDRLDVNNKVILMLISCYGKIDYLFKPRQPYNLMENFDSQFFYSIYKSKEKNVDHLKQIIKEELEKLKKFSPSAVEFSMCHSADEFCAVSACSGGLFNQKFNDYKKYGYADPFEMQRQYQCKENSSLFDFIKDIKRNDDIHLALIRHDWGGFANKFNQYGKVSSSVIANTYLSCMSS